MKDISIVQKPSPSPVKEKLKKTATLSLSKEEENQEEKDKKKVVYKSSRQTSFSYSTSLPRMVDSTKAAAEVENGVVKVTVPKMEEEKPKKISVTKK